MTDDTYTIKYNANGGTGAPTSQIKTYNKTLTLSSSKPIRKGYTFLGWSTNSSAISPSYRSGDVFTDNSNTTLYAIWEEIILTDVSIASYPDKRQYYMGENLDLTGLIVRLKYSDGLIELVTDDKLAEKGFTVTGFDSTEEAEKLYVYLNYGRYTESISIQIVSSYVKLSNTKITLDVGDTFELKATTYPASGGTIKWNHWGGSNIITLDNGKITAIGPGTATISAEFSYAGYHSSAVCEVVVNAPTLSSVSIKSLPNKVNYYIGDSFSTEGLKLKLTYSDGSTKEINSGFTTSGFSSATAGTKTITVSYSGFTNTFNVTVKTPTISLSHTNKIMNVGGSFAIEATTIPSAKVITWSSNNQSVANWEYGLIKAKSAGTAIITAEFTYNGQTYRQSCVVTVVLSGDIDGNKTVTDADAVYLLMYTFFPEDYEVNQAVDFDGDGEVTDADAVYLLMYTFFQEDYPIA